MTRTNKKIQKTKLINNNVIIHQDKTILNIDNIINELKKEYEILEYKTEHNNFLNNILYTLKITFIINSKETQIFISVFLNDTSELIINKIKNRLNTCNNIQCDICYNEFITYKCSKVRITCSQCNLIYCYNCFKNLVIYGNGIINCPNCRKITDTTLRDSRDIKLFLSMSEAQYS